VRRLGGRDGRAIAEIMGGGRKRGVGETAESGHVDGCDRDTLIQWTRVKRARSVGRVNKVRSEVREEKRGRRAERPKSG
jgi:hypothetical protein